MEDNNLASELLRLVKTQAKRWFIAFIIVLAFLFVSNALWLYAWCQPTDTTETTITSATDGDANYIAGDGDINNGKY